MLPTTYQVSVATLIQAAIFAVPTVGALEVAAAETIVVVPDVTAEIVTVPAPRFRIFSTVPTGNATEALVGILKATAVALFIGTSFW
jgi:hypothetical protein